MPIAALPHSNLHDDRFTPNDKVPVGHHFGFAPSSPTCWPSNNRLASNLGVAVRTVQYGMRRLELASWIRYEECEANRTGRLINLTWRITPPMQRVAPPVQHVAPEGDRVVKEKTIGEGPTRTTRPEPAQALFGETPRVMRREPIPATPPAPLQPPPRKRPTSLSLEELARLAADDPILAAEHARRTAPRPEAPPPTPEDAPTSELIERIQESPSHPPRIAHRLTVEFSESGQLSGIPGGRRAGMAGGHPRRGPGRRLPAGLRAARQESGSDLPARGEGRPGSPGHHTGHGPGGGQGVRGGREPLAR